MHINEQQQQTSGGEHIEVAQREQQRDECGMVHGNKER